MAVTVTLQNAIVAARIAADAASIPASVTASAQILYDGSKAEIEQYAPDAPEAVQNLALVRMLAYLWQLPPGGSARGYTSALRNSGAAGSLSRWRAVRLGLDDDEE